MPPKKTAAQTLPETASDAPVEEEVEEEVEEKTDAAAPPKVAAHPTTAVMVRQALTELDSRKGVSSKAIQSYIKEKYPSVDSEKLKSLVRRNLRKGLETGVLVRPAKSNVTAGATGSFRLAPQVKESKAKRENTDPNVKKETKATKDGAKKPKKTGTTKKGETGKEEAKKKKDPKPPKKDGEATASKPAPAKKPKAKKTQADGVGTSSSAKTKDSKTAKGGTKTTKAKAGAAPQSKATKKGDASAPKAPGKRGKKAAAE